jgi:uncharacterized protein
MRLFACVVCGLIAANTCLAQVTQTDTGRTLISATGVVRQTLTPDRAVLVVLLEPQAMSVEEAGNRLVAVERAVLDTLRRFNLPASAIQMYNSGVMPYRNQMNPSVSGPSYAGREIVRIELTRLDMIPAVTAAALAKGASYVLAPSFTASNADSARHALIPQAFQTSQRDAEALAKAAGGRLGKLIDVTMQQTPSFPDVAQTAFLSSNIQYDNGQRSVPTSVVTASVTTRWVLIR